jgi:N-acetylglucosaminyldiphosphoundecaprenol N-acetyl-beta-D-mannosaminyltransferase
MTSPATPLRTAVINVEREAATIRAVEQPALKQHCANVLGIKVEPLDMREALARLQDALASSRKGYICMAGVHGIMEGQRIPAVRRAFADSLMSLPDGAPTVWVGRSQGFSRMRRVAGPDLMLEVFRSRQFADYSHFFYGGKPGVALELASNLKERFPWARIVGMYTPPFRDLNHREECELIALVRRMKPSIIWVGISTPRQELFMQKYLHLLDTSLMFGVGAAFDFHTGRIRDCAEWIKRAGLQWLHRLVQDPRHLFWRYLRNNPAFVWRILLQMAARGRSVDDALAAVAEDDHLLCDGASERRGGLLAINEQH